MVETPAFIPIEEKHGEDCTCPSAGRIEIELVAADRACPWDRNPHRAARTATEVVDFAPFPPHDLSDDGPHCFPVREPLTVPYQYDACACGLQLGESIEAARKRLAGEPLLTIPRDEQHTHEFHVKDLLAGQWHPCSCGETFPAPPGGHSDGPTSSRP